MTLAIDITDGHGLGNGVYRAKEEQGNYNVVLAVHFTVKAFNQLYITNKTECSLGFPWELCLHVNVYTPVNIFGDSIARRSRDFLPCQCYDYKFSF